MEQRANLFVELCPPFTKEEKLMGPKIVAKNRTIKKKMHMLFSDLKQEMKIIQQKKSRIKPIPIHIAIFARRTECFWIVKNK